MIALGALNPASAQTAETTPADASASGYGDDIVVTASKRNESIRNVGGAVSAVTGEQLENLNAKSLADYAAYVPGLTLQPSGRPGETVVTIRGITALSVGAATGTYIDDVPYGSANNYSGGAGLTPDLDPSDLQRVEVLKGPQGTLYGASSLGGLVKYVTRDPDLNKTELRSAADFGVIAHGGTSYEGRLAGNVPLIDDTLGLRVSGYYRDDAGYVDDLGVGGSDTNHTKVYGLRAALLFRPVAALTVKLSALFQNIESDGVGAVDVSRTTLQPLYGDLTQRRKIGESDAVKNRLYSASLDYDLGGVTLTSATGYAQVRSNPHTDYSDYLRSSVGASATQTVQALAGMRTNKFTQELRLASAASGNFEWIIGGFYQHESSNTDQNYKVYNADGTPATGTLAVPYQNNYFTKLNEYAGFGNITYYLAPSFDITVGYRLSHNDQDITRQRSGTIGNPASPTTFRVRSQSSKETVSTYLATARWRVSPDALIYARAASGYRPGGPRDIAPGAVAPADFKYSFDADTVWNYEIGTKAKWLDGRLTTDISAFLIDWKDIQALMPVGAFRVFGNAGKAQIKGVEFNGKLTPVTGLNIGGNVTYTDAKLQQSSTTFSAVKGDALPYTARWTSAATLDYQAPVSADWTGFINGAWRYTSSRVTDFSLVTTKVTLPAYSLFDAQIGAFDGNGLRLTVFVKNIADKRAYTAAYSNLSTALPLSLAVVQPRTIGMSLTKAF